MSLTHINPWARVQAGNGPRMTQRENETERLKGREGRRRRGDRKVGENKTVRKRKRAEDGANGTRLALVYATLAPLLFSRGTKRAGPD